MVPAPSRPVNHCHLQHGGYLFHRADRQSKPGGGVFPLYTCVCISHGTGKPAQRWRSQPHVPLFWARTILKNQNRAPRSVFGRPLYPGDLPVDCRKYITGKTGSFTTAEDAAKAIIEFCAGTSQPSKEGMFEKTQNNLNSD